VVPSAASYQVWYGITSGGENKYYSTATNSYTLTANAGASGTIPATNTTGQISAAGNITASYINGNINGTITTSNISITGNVTASSVIAGNIVNATSHTGTTVSVSGNVNAASVSASGNITVGSGSFFLGNGASLTGLSVTSSANSIANGTSNINIPVTNGNITMTVSGISNVALLASTGVYVTGVMSASGNILAGGQISAVGNLTGTGFSTTGAGGSISGTGSITGAGLFSTTTLSAAGNVTGGNILTGGIISAAGNIYGTIVGTISTSSASLSGNLQANNVIATTIVNAASHTGGLVSVTGNITGNNITAATSITVNSNNAVTAIVNGAGNAIGNIGSTSSYFNQVYAQATTALYADLAEVYEADTDYSPGTVVSFGGSKEVSISTQDADPTVAGVISANPSYLMNNGLTADHRAIVALTGRVPTSVTGTVSKGSMMISAGNGRARACATPAMGTVIGKALENFNGENGIIEIVVGRM
jgi:hypothetical protein